MCSIFSSTHKNSSMMSEVRKIDIEQTRVLPQKIHRNHTARILNGFCTFFLLSLCFGRIGTRKKHIHNWDDVHGINTENRKNVPAKYLVSSMSLVNWFQYPRAKQKIHI